LISVIIPTADRPPAFLLDAVTSVLAQTLAPMEILVMDNGLRAVDPAILPGGVTLVRLAPRVGPSRARNAGAAKARGAHLAFLDDE
jgi:glycosyltransferase involved in cell wall biosynthesis